MPDDTKNIRDILNQAISEIQHTYQGEMTIENILYYAQTIIDALDYSNSIKESLRKELLILQDII